MTPKHRSLSRRSQRRLIPGLLFATHILCSRHAALISTRKTLQINCLKLLQIRIGELHTLKLLGNIDIVAIDSLVGTTFLVEHILAINPESKHVTVFVSTSNYII